MLPIALPILYGSKINLVQLMVCTALRFKGKHNSFMIHIESVMLVRFVLLWHMPERHSWKVEGLIWLTASEASDHSGLASWLWALDWWTTLPHGEQKAKHWHRRGSGQDLITTSNSHCFSQGHDLGQYLLCTRRPDLWHLPSRCLIITLWMDLSTD